MLTFQRDHSTVRDLLQLLELCDQDFHPPLSERVNLNWYAKRMALHTVRFEAWDGSVLVGLVAAYCNAPDKAKAFITNVSVLLNHRGQGVSKKLLRSAYAYAVDNGFASMSLEVNKNAIAALALYRGEGFEITSQTGDTLTLIRLLTHCDVRDY